jgi:transcriptional regulator with XRE-family HTH domain
LTLVKKKISKTDPLLSSVCQALKERREHLGISQEGIAEKAGLHRTYISDIERGARNPTLKTLSRLASSLDISTSALIRMAELKLKNQDYDNTEQN